MRFLPAGTLKHAQSDPQVFYRGSASQRDDLHWGFSLLLFVRGRGWGVCHWRCWRLDAGDHVRCLEGDLLTLGEVLGDVFVQSRSVDLASQGLSM